MITLANPAHCRSLLFSLLAALLFLLVGGALVHWSWNMIGHELFGVREIGFRHGVALMVTLLVIAAPFRLGTCRLAGQGQAG